MECKQQSQKKAGVAVLTLDEVDFQTGNITGDKERHYVRINGSVHQEDIEPKREIDKSTIRVGDFNTHLGNW